MTIDLAHLSAAYSFRHQPAGTGAAHRFRQLARAVREGRQLELVYWVVADGAYAKRPFRKAARQAKVVVVSRRRKDAK